MIAVPDKKGMIKAGSTSPLITFWRYRPIWGQMQENRSVFLWSKVTLWVKAKPWDSYPLMFWFCFKSSKKGHKLTKAQRARQQQEEEERKLREGHWMIDTGWSPFSFQLLFVMFLFFQKTLGCRQKDKNRRDSGGSRRRGRFGGWSWRWDPEPSQTEKGRFLHGCLPAGRGAQRRGAGGAAPPPAGEPGESNSMEERGRRDRQGASFCCVFIDTNRFELTGRLESRVSEAGATAESFKTLKNGGKLTFRSCKLLCQRMFLEQIGGKFAKFHATKRYVRPSHNTFKTPFGYPHQVFWFCGRFYIFLAPFLFLTDVAR